MKKQNIQNVTINADFTTDQPTLSITLDGYPLLQQMEDLQEQHHIIQQKIENLVRITSGSKAATSSAARKREEVKILKEQQEQIQSKFESLIPFVKKYAKSKFDNVDCKIIISHYCNINKTRGNLQDDINEIIDCTARNFRVKLQNQWLKNLCQKL